MPTDIRTTASATFQADDARKAKTDKGTTVPISQCDTKVCAAWANDVDEKLEQVNAAFVDGSPVLALSVGDGTTVPNVVIDGSGGSVLAWKEGSTTRWETRVDAGTDFEIARFDSNGVEQEESVRIRSADGDVIIANRLAVSGAEPEDAWTIADDLVIGSNTMQNTGLTLLSKNNSFGRMVFSDTSTGTIIGGMAYSHNADVLFFAASGASLVALETGEWRPITDQDVSLGTSTLRWDALHTMSGTFYGNVMLGSASPAFAVGDGTGSPVCTLDKVGTGTASIELDNGGGSSHRFHHDASEDLRVQWWDSGGPAWDDVVVVSSGGSLQLAKPPQVESGARLHSGSGAPGSGLGADGDIYFRTDGSAGTVIYFKASGSWSALA